MIKLINKLTGTDMWVDESRAEKYIAAGHKPAAPASVEEATQEEPAEEAAEEQEEEAAEEPEEAEAAKPEEKKSAKKKK